MKPLQIFIPAVAVLFLTAGVAQGDWFDGDPHKMHYPQLPDPNGWDIEIFTAGHEVADDWQCSATGPVSDIHFWYSVLGDGGTLFDTVTAVIYDNVPDPDGPGPGFSMPGQELWRDTFDVLAGEVGIIDPYGTGNQGFADPQIGWTPNDHQTYQQANIVDIPDPFEQQQGEIYWLGLYVDWFTGIRPPVGWKTSLDVFEDDAVFRGGTGTGGAWQELIDPTGRSLHMAFVITPEPGTLALIALGGMVLLRRR